MKSDVLSFVIDALVFCLLFAGCGIQGEWGANVESTQQARLESYCNRGLIGRDNTNYSCQAMNQTERFTIFYAPGSCQQDLVEECRTSGGSIAYEGCSGDSCQLNCRFEDCGGGPKKDHQSPSLGGGLPFSGVDECNVVKMVERCDQESFKHPDKECSFSLRSCSCACTGVKVSFE